MKRCLGILALFRGEPINVGCLIYENIKMMTNVAQRACGHFYVINKLCRRVGVLTYPDDKMICPKAPINASVIRRLQYNHPVEVTQPDQEDNQAGKEEEFYQPQVSQHEMHIQGNQQASKFQRRIEAHAVGVTRWIIKDSQDSHLYLETSTTNKKITCLLIV